MQRDRLWTGLVAITVALITLGAAPVSERTIDLHGRPQQIRIMGDPRGRAVIVSSGDGGWMHVAPHVAEWLAERGYFVIGFDTKAYLSSESAERPLDVDQIPGDYARLLDAVPASAGLPILLGISAGGGLSVRAAASPAIGKRIAGVVTLGLGDVNELAWHWRDSIIYITKGKPREPSFHAADFMSSLSPVPVVLVRATSDEFVPAAESDRLATLARAPKRLLTVRASNHSFADNLAGLDAALADTLSWLVSHAAVRTGA